MAPPNLTSVSLTLQQLNTLDVEFLPSHHTSFDVPAPNTPENTHHTFSHHSQLYFQLKNQEPILSTVKTSHQHYPFNTTVPPTETSHCFPFFLFSILLHSFSPHLLLLQCVNPDDNVHQILTNRFSYLVAKPFRPTYSPGFSAVSSNNNGRRAFGEIATSVAKNLSPELGADDSLTEEMEFVVAGTECQTGNGQWTPTVGLSDSQRSDYDPSSVLKSRETVPYTLRTWETGAIGFILKLRQAGTLSLAWVLMGHVQKAKTDGNVFVGHVHSVPEVSPPSGQPTPKRQRLEE